MWCGGGLTSVPLAGSLSPLEWAGGAGASLFFDYTLFFHLFGGHIPSFRYVDVPNAPPVRDTKWNGAHRAGALPSVSP